MHQSLRTFVYLCALAFIGWGFLNSVNAAENVYQLSGTGQTQSDETGEQYVGSTQLIINGELLSAVVTVTISGPFELTGDGSQTAPSSHFIDFGNGDSITTSETMTLFPDDPDGQKMQAVLGVTEGTGIYANTHGSLVLNGHMPSDLKTAEWNLNGSIEN